MQIVTIALPLGFTHPEVNPETAPVWVDAEGFEYLMASGLIEAEATEETTASPDRITVVVGMPGLDAAKLMGLSLPDEEL